MAFSTGDKTARTLAEINVVPLVDVMLVLLIIFMITAPVMMRGTDVAVPKTKSGTAIGEDRLIITITKENQLYAQNKKEDRIGVDELPALIQTFFASRSIAEADRTIFVRADEAVSYAMLMTVIDSAKQASVQKVGLITDPKTDDSDVKKGR